MNMELTTLTVLIATVVVYFIQMVIMGKQLKAMQEQISEGRNMARGQNFLSWINFIQSEDKRNSRGFVMGDLKDKSFEEWNESDKRHVSKVCASYDATGILMRQKLIIDDPILYNWGISVEKCYPICEPYIKYMRQKNGRKNYWGNFQWMYEEYVKGMSEKSE